MTWRGTSILTRIYGSLPYLIPLSSFVRLGGSLVAALPFLRSLQALLRPIAIIEASLWGLVIFIALVIGVVNNPKVQHFIRFNTIQAILISIGILLIQVCFDVLGQIGFPIQFVSELTYTVTSLTLLAAVGYAWFENAQGNYPDKIPYLSSVAYNFTR